MPDQELLKGDAKARVQAGLKYLEIGLEESLWMSAEHKNDLVEAKELCEKQGVKGKMKSEGEIPKREEAKSRRLF